MINFNPDSIKTSTYNKRRNFILNLSGIFVGLILFPKLVVTEKNRWILSSSDF